MLNESDHALRMKCVHLLYKICGHHALLPGSLVIPVSYDRTEVPLYHGGFAEVWKGISRGREVAVKVLKLYQCSNKEQIRKVGDRSPFLSAMYNEKLTATIIEVL